MTKYFQLFLASFIYKKESQKEVIIRSAFYVVIVYIFSQLWAMTGGSEGAFPLERLTWYLAITEVIVLANPIIYFDIESDIRSGDIAYHLTRPVHYLGLRICENLGVYTFRFAILSLVGFFFCSWLTRGAFSPGWELLVTGALAYISGAVLLLWHALIGLSAFKFQDCAPLFWLWQRSTFFLGGLLLPLEFYPEFLQNLARWTPFEALLHSPARQILDFSFEGSMLALLKILLWGVLGILLSLIFYKRAIAKLRVNGG